MAKNPLESLLPKDPQGPGMGKELSERMRMQREAGGSLTHVPVETPHNNVSREPSPVDKTGTQGPYGSGPGEKRIDVKDMVRPLGQMHSGGTVPKDGAYNMKAGEKVLTPEQHGQLHNAMSLAQSALSHEAPPEPPKPAKMGHTFSARKLDDKTFHVRKGHTSPGDHPDEEATAPDMKGLIKHLQDHFGKDEPESPGVEAAEQTVGLEK